MNMFSYVKSQVVILDIINEYTTLKQAGLYWKGCCPFHREKTASFTVSPHKEIFYCFGCHVGGDVISFIAKIENYSQLDAAKYLVERYQLELPKELSFDMTEQSVDKKNNYTQLCKLTADWCHENLLKSSVLMRYLYDRGFNKESINYFSIGYFPGGLQSIKYFIQYMRTHNIMTHDLFESNVIAQGKTILYSPFEERLIFPIKDYLGRFCGFGGRIFKQQDTRPKYYNSRENVFFNKGSLLFGIDLAKKKMQETETVFLVEGYTDCIAMVQHGFTNTVATLGTSCTLSHLQQLSRYVKKLYVTYDGDNAGKQAILRLTDLCWKVDIQLCVISMPQKEDPASFLLKKGDFISLINEAKDIFLFFIESLGNDFITKPLLEKVKTTRSLLKIIYEIDDSLKQDILLQKASKTFDIPYEILHREFERIEDADQKKSLEDTVDKVSSSLKEVKSFDDNSLQLEKKIFCAIINNMKLFSCADEYNFIDYLPQPLCNILKKLKLRIDKVSFNFDQFFDVLDEQQKLYISKILLEQEEIIDENLFQQLLVQLQKKQWKIIVKNIKTKLILAKQAGDEVKVKEILGDFLILKKKMVVVTFSNK